jgi:hypothetical protein
LSNNPQVNCSFTELVPIPKINPHPKNPNKHSPEQIERLAKIIAYQGFRHPVIVSKRSGYIVAGHGRLEAAILNNYSAVPVDYQDFDSDEAEYAFLVSDNAIAEWSELDLSSINTDLPEFGPSLDVELLGIQKFEIDPPQTMEGKPRCSHCGQILRTKDSHEKVQARAELTNA